MLKSAATWSEGTARSGGFVVLSYGFTRSRPVTRSSLPLRTSNANASIQSSHAVRVPVSSSTLASLSTSTTNTISRLNTVVSARSSSKTISTDAISVPTLTGSLDLQSTVSSVVTSQSQTNATNTILSQISSNTTLARKTRTRKAKVVAQSVTSTVFATTVTAQTVTATFAPITRTATQSSNASATASAPSMPTMPLLPNGAQLVQFRGCLSSPNTIPMLVSKNYPVDDSVSSASTVWIVQHGSARNFDDYFSSVYRVVGNAGVVIAPNFYAADDKTAPDSCFQPDVNLAWYGNTWSLGQDAISPAGVSGCSSFDVYDSLIDSLRDRTKYPNLHRIFIVAHSAGAAMMGRYGMVSGNADIKYVLANAPAMPYFTPARSDNTTNCGNYDSWGYGWTSSLPRYVSSRTFGPITSFRNWVSRDVTLMTGTFDTYSRDMSGDQSCGVIAQGGQNRRDRGYAFWAYINLLAGTDTDVSEYYGYDTLQPQVTSIWVPSFHVRHCVVDGIAHDNDAMFASACGRAAINGLATLPPGPGPVRPP